MAMSEKVINREELGKSLCIVQGDTVYLQRHMFSRVEQVKINYVEIIQDNSTYPKGTMQYAANGIMGAIIAGTLGILLVSAFAQTKWDIDFDIHLIDGRVVEIRTIYKSTVKALLKHILPIDPRIESRRRRGIM